MPFYVRDYLADTVHLSTLEHGAYLMLIMHYWLHEGLPSDDAKLTRIVRLSPEQWADIRATLADLFEPGWRHKRIEAELANTKEKYLRRSEAGRQGGRASGLARQSRTSAEAMLQHEASDAKARLNQPQPQSQAHKEESQSGAHTSADNSEEWFWARLNSLATLISRSQCMQLLELNGGDFMETNRVLDLTEQAQSPRAYLGKVIRNLQQGSKASSPGTNPHVPAWVNERRAAGILVEREGKHWRCQGYLLNDAGDEVGF
jgi:uncharacterized protein YdaU (DUF1376 family)